MLQKPTLLSSRLKSYGRFGWYVVVISTDCTRFFSQTSSDLSTAYRQRTSVVVSPPNSGIMQPLTLAYTNQRAHTSDSA